MLAALGGVTGLGAVGYVSARKAARQGTVNGRLVIGYERNGSTIVDQTPILKEFVDPDGSPDRRTNPEYRDGFPTDPPMTVPKSLHQKLQSEFDEVDYALSHSCPDLACSTPIVSRPDFNDTRLGAEVRLLYHSGDSATVIP